MQNQTRDTMQYRLHHLPFALMWVAAFGVAWLGIFMLAFTWADIMYDYALLSNLSNWVYNNAPWLTGLLMGAGLGAFLAVVQPWLIRWRYGFVPRFWRITTFVGAILGGTLFSDFIYSSGYYNIDGLWTYPNQILSIVLWLSALTLVQMLALWPVVRRAWLYPLAGFGALVIALLTTLGNSYGANQLNMLFFGTASQAIFSAGLFLWLMRDYRVEAVQKRDEKSKGQIRNHLHPISFIGLWSVAHLFGWVSLISLALIYSLISNLAPFIGYFFNWIFNNQWLMSMAVGAVIGGVLALAQPWLMAQASGYRPRFWLPLSVLAWALAGFGLWELMRFSNYDYANNPYSPFWKTMMFLLWFALPPALQSFALGRDLRGAWLYALAGVVSAAMAYFLYQQFQWSSGANIYAVIFGAGVQAILTGAAFLSIMSQQKPAQSNVEEAQAETVLE